MAEVNLTINGRNYGIACDDGQEKRLRDLGYYVDQRLKEIAKAGAATNETHLMVLASLMLADEVFDLRDNLGAIDEQVQVTQSLVRDDAAIADAINDLAGRVGEIADRIQKV
jgi:cell division protein ZapA